MKQNVFISATNLVVTMETVLMDTNILITSGSL